MKRITLSLTMAFGCLMSTQSYGFDLLDRMLGSKGCGCDTACCDTPVVDPACGCETASAGCGLLGGLGKKGCGLLGGGASRGCEAPACGCESATCDNGSGEPACGAEGCGLLGGGCGLLGKGASCGCENAVCDNGGAPACGCENSGCDSAGCLPKAGLLTKLFGKHGAGCDSACGGAAEPACGSEGICGALSGCDSGCDSGCLPKIKRPGLLKKLFGGLHGSSCDAACDTAAGCECGGTVVPVAEPVSAPAHVETQAAPAPVVDPSASIKTKSRVVQASARYVR